MGKGNGADLTDEISVAYQTTEWSKPAKLVLKEIAQADGIAIVEARVLDQAGVPCLDAANLIRFGVAGDGQLLDNLGTAAGSRAVQLGNGRAQISVKLTGPAAVVSVSTPGIETELLQLKKAKP